MADDVVELAEGSIDAGDVQGPQLDVLEFRPVDGALARADLHRGKVHAHHRRVRMAGGDGDQVTACSAAQFEHTRLLERRGAEAKEKGQGFEMLDRRLGERMRLVRNDIVVIRGRWRRR